MKHEVKVNVPEGLKERVDRVKQHLKDNRTTYLVGAGCLAVGYFLRKPQTIKVISNGAAPVFNNTPTIAPVMNNIVHNTVNNGGHCTKIVRCLETGETLAVELTEAADEISQKHDISFDRARCTIQGHQRTRAAWFRRYVSKTLVSVLLAKLAGKTRRIMRPTPFG